MPAQNAKTRRKYKWGMKRKVSPAVRLVAALLSRASLEHLGDQHYFRKRLYDWFDRRLLPDAARASPVVKHHLSSGLKYNLRTVRARFGTEWAFAKEQAAKEGKEAPPNPLQHASERTTYRSYVALEDSDAEDASEEGDVKDKNEAHAEAET